MKDKLMELAETLRLGDCNDAECLAMANLITQLLDAEGDGDGGAVGEVGTTVHYMPGTEGFTMACFKASEVPPGTQLYTHPARSGVVSDEDVRDAERYRWLQKTSPYRFRKIQDASVTDGGDVMYFHKDRFDSAIDATIQGSPIGRQWASNEYED
jgi:hypothetical protein